jgi:hypothetical protein
MVAVPFDTLAFARKLEAAGFPQQQAQDTAAALAEVMSEQVATKHDLEVLKHDLTLRLGAMMAAAVGIVAVLVRLL